MCANNNLLMLMVRSGSSTRAASMKLAPSTRHSFGSRIRPHEAEGPVEPFAPSLGVGQQTARSGEDGDAVIAWCADRLASFRVPERVEFSVIGPAANQVARMEDLTKSVGQRVVVSRELADHAGRGLKSRELLNEALAEG